MATLNIKGFPEELYQHLATKAKEDRRSLSAEVIYLLGWAVEATMSKKQSISQLKGLGKKYTKNMDATKHINEERTSWD